MKLRILFVTLLAVLGAQRVISAPLQQNGTSKVESSPIAKLPTHIKAAGGQVGLIADFEHKRGSEVDIYLVNATDVEIALASQDGDIGCKREAKLADGKWRRCDSHAYSDCGNSYSSKVVEAGHFMAWTQACDTQTGQVRPLRFKLYSQTNLAIVSNEGSGVVDEGDVEFCRYDALAMRHGPFEDVAAVATRKVLGGQGSSFRGLNDAIGALARFPMEKRLFSVVQEVIRDLQSDIGAEPVVNESAYTQCVKSLQSAVDNSLSREELWNFLNAEFHDESFPWRSTALSYLVREFKWDQAKLKPVIEEVLSANGHPALQIAASAYAEIVEKSKAGIRLAAIENDKGRSEGDREIARRVRASLFPNPYLSITVEHGEPLWNNGGLSPLKKITISNVSPQAITLPVAKPEALFVLELSKWTNNAEARPELLVMNDEPGALTLQAGQSVVIKDVKWWELLRNKHIDPEANYSVYFLARSPGLWDISARPNWNWIPRGNEILKALNMTKAEGK